MRKITDALYNEIEKRLASNGAAQKAIADKNPRNLFIYAAECMVGTLEVGGNNKGKFVELFQMTVDGKAQREAWCMAFVQSMLAYVEKKLNVTSPIFASEHCLTTWQKTPKAQRVKAIPAPGAIVIWQHGKTTSGHTGLMLEWQDKNFEAVEGNTESGINPKGAVVRDGGGVYMTKRGSKGSGSMKVVGFLKPF